MPRKPRPKRATPGRPKAPIDWEVVKRQVSAGASGVSIAHELGIASDTLYDRCIEDMGMEFTEFKRLHVSRGNDLIAMKQFELAMKGDKSLLIWLGKNRLGQRDRQEYVNAAGESVPVVMVQVMPPSPDAGK